MYLGDEGEKLEWGGSNGGREDEVDGIGCYLVCHTGEGAHYYC